MICAARAGQPGDVKAITLFHSEVILKQWPKEHEKNTDRSYTETTEAGPVQKKIHLICVMTVTEGKKPDRQITTKSL